MNLSVGDTVLESTNPDPATICTLWEGGLSVCEIARLLHTPRSSVFHALLSSGVTAHHRARPKPKPAARPLYNRRYPDNREALWELYWGENSGYPNLTALARRFATWPCTLRQAFARHGIPLRTRSEQYHLDVAAGVRAPNVPPSRPATPVRTPPPRPPNHHLRGGLKVGRGRPWRSPEDLFLRIERTSTGCWLWTGRRNENGYGIVKFQGKKWLVHRLIWELFRGPIPDGYHLDHHRCHHRHCVSPAHLIPLDPTTHGRKHGRPKK